LSRGSLVGLAVSIFGLDLPPRFLRFPEGFLLLLASLPSCLKLLTELLLGLFQFLLTGPRSFLSLSSGLRVCLQFFYLPFRGFVGCLLLTEHLLSIRFPVATLLLEHDRFVRRLHLRILSTSPPKPTKVGLIPSLL
jgi:hypothetical protein